MKIGKSKNGKYLKASYSPDEIKAQIAQYQNVIDWVELNCEILPCQAALQMNAHHRAKLNKAIGSSSIDSILTAQEQNSLLYSEDANLRSIAATENQVSGTAGFMFVLFLKTSRKISPERYTTLMVDLFSLNYKGIPTELRILMEATRRSKYKLCWPLNNALEGLVSPLMDDIYILKLVCRYLLAIFKEPTQIIIDQDIMILQEQLVIGVLKVLGKHFDLKRSEQPILIRLTEESGVQDKDAIIIRQIVSQYIASLN